MKIYIFSEINYYDNKHINQYLFDYLISENIDCYFIERVSMGIPLKGIWHRFIDFFSKKNSTSQRINNPNNDRIIKSFILPSSPLFRIINKFIFKKNKLILNKDDILISFVPHEHIYSICGRNAIWVYYCVHDTTQQKYCNKKSILHFERNSLSKNSVMFCDNQHVIDKLGLDSISYLSETNQGKCHSFSYLMPPPVPNEFYIKKTLPDVLYDFVYYGSFHENIDNNIILSISNEYKIIIISNNVPSILHGHKNITIVPSIYSMSDLANAINSAKFILLPYKNTQFMETITPAKILQVKAFSKPVLCTNKSLSEKYSLSNDINKLLTPERISSIYSVNEICSFILNKINHNAN
ncbi:TPA: hypothetical protein ACS7XC_003822 [Providencia alcalifaciens]